MKPVLKTVIFWDIKQVTRSVFILVWWVSEGVCKEPKSVTAGLCASQIK